MTVLKARVGSSWVAVSGGSVWDTAWGIVAMGDVTNNILSLAPPPGVPVTTSISFKPMNGRRYVLKFATRAIGSAGAASSHFDLYIDGVLIALSDSYYEGELSYGSRPFEWLITGTGVSHTYQIYGVGAATTQLHNQNGGFNAYFYIEDVGPVASAAVQSLVTPWTNLVLQNNWIPSPAWQVPQYRKVGDMVHIRGTMNGGSPANSGMVVANLPVGYRPPAQISMATEGNADFKWFLINTAGDVLWYVPATQSAPSQTSSFHLNHQFSVSA